MFELPDVDIIFEIILPHIFTFKIIIVGGEKVIPCGRKKKIKVKVFFFRKEVVCCY